MQTPSKYFKYVGPGCLWIHGHVWCAEGGVFISTWSLTKTAAIFEFHVLMWCGFFFSLACVRSNHSSACLVKAVWVLSQEASNPCCSLVSFADSGGMPERPCVLTGPPESIEWVLISFFSFLLLSLLPNAVLCQWCYSVSHTNSCWPRETWGSLEHRASWSDALNCTSKAFFSPVVVWTLCRNFHGIPLRRARLLLGHLGCSFLTAALQDTELSCWRALLFSPSLPSCWADVLPAEEGLHEASKACQCHSRIPWRCWWCCTEHEALGRACLCTAANKKQRTEPKSWILIPAW